MLDTNTFKKKAIPLPRTVWTNPIHFIACAFGFGALPWMPGTWATLASIPLCLALSRLPLWIYALITALCILGGVWVCGKANQDFGTLDHPACAWDEMASFLLVMIAIPKTWYFFLIGFVIFRFLDIVKPQPIRWIDRHVHGGLGVMLDDVVAAMVTWALLFFLAHLLGK